MGTGSNKAEGGESRPVGNGKARKKRNWVRWSIFGVTVFLAILALVITLVPEYAAREIMRGELAKIGIETTGTESLYLNPWRGEIRMGPVEFWSEGAERGEVGMVSAQLSLATLFKKRALIETFIIEEVDLIIEQRKDGIFVNGVSIRQFMTAEDEAAVEVEEGAEEEEKVGWGAGIDQFQFRDSKLILKNFVEGDELEIEIDHLFVTLFHTWDRDDPGVVSLLGKLAGATLFFDATARPFADDIKFRFEAGIKDVPIARAMDYGRIAAVFDKDMFTRREGTGSTTLSFSGFLFEDGSIEMNGEQKATFEDLHLVTPEGVSFKLDTAALGMRSAQTVVPEGRTEVAGEFTSSVEGLEFGTKEGLVVRLDTVQTNSDTFFAEVNPDQSISAAAPHQSVVTGLHVTVDPETRMDFDVVTFGINTFNFDQSPDGEVDLSSAIKILLEQVSATAAPNTRVEVANISIDTDDIAVKQKPEGSITVSATPTITLASTQLQGPAAGSVEQISLEVSSLVADLVGETVSVETSSSTNLAAVKLTAPGAEGQPGADVSVDTVRLDLQNFAANVAGGATKVSGAIGSEIAGLAASVPQAGGDMTVAADRLATSFPTLNAEVSGGDVKANGSIGSEIAGLAASIPQDGGKAMTVEAGDVQTSFSSVNAQVSADSTTVSLAGETNVAAFKTIMPAAPGRPEINVGLGSIDVAMKEVAASVAGAEPKWKVSTDVAVKKLATSLKTAESTSTFDVGSVNINGLKTDQALAIAIGAIVVAGIDADLVDKDLAAFGGGSETEGAPAKASGPKDGEPRVRLGRLAVGEGSTVQFTDTGVDPPVIVVVGLDEVEIKDIDTGNPGKQTDIKLNATINESSTLRVNGWAMPLKPTPDFDLNVDLKALPLPAYSSYVSDAIGWNLDGGDLSTTVNATANNNALGGQVGVLVDNLFLNPVTAADGEKLEKQIGVPVQFAVGILKDDQGRIDLDLPLAGTLDKPEVDYSSVIQKAISGFLGSIFGSDSFQGADGFKLLPVVFAPGSAELTDAGRQSAENYVAMLEKKPSLKLGVCGRANVQDFVALFGSKALPPLQPTQASTAAAPAGQAAAGAGSRAAISTAQAKALVELAMERTNVVRGYFVEEKGINTERIVQCRVTYDIEDTQPPRAQFAM